MTVRVRTLLIVGSAMLALLIGQYALLRYAFVRALTTIENVRVIQQVNQAGGELRKEISNIDSVTADYAAWDKTYAYVARPNRDFAESDLADEALRRLRLDAVIIVNNTGREVLFRSLLAAPELEAVHSALAAQMKPGSPLVSFSSADAGHIGLIDMGGGPVAVAMRPVLTSAGTGSGRGVILMARRFDEHEIRRIGETIHLAISLNPAPASGPADRLPADDTDGVRIDLLGSNQIAGEVSFADIRNVQRWHLRVVSDRPLHLEAERWFVYFILTFFLSLLGVAAVTLVLLDRIVLRPLSRMSQEVTRIAHTGDLTRQVGSGGHDELAAVGSAIDFMLERIRESRAAAEHSASEASRIKSEFLATVSHEIRTPLHGVLGTLKILEDTPLNPDQQNLLRTTRSSAEGLHDLLNDVLDLSKLEAGKMTFDSEPFDLRETAEDVLGLFGPLIGSKPLDLLFAADVGLPDRIVGDPGRVRQVLVNLVGNAVKFTDAGHVLLELAVERTDATAVIVMRVSDTGIGISRDKLSAIFESFAQADAATTRRFGGTGLGLTISRRLLTLMGGDIAVASEPGQGTTFTCRLPLVEATSSADRARISGRVLLVDSPGLRRTVYAGTLRDLGLDVTEADTAAAASSDSDGRGGHDQCTIVIAPEGQLLPGALEPRIVVLRTRLSTVPQAAANATVLVQPVSRDQWRRAFGAPASPDRPLPHHRLGGRVLLAEDNRVNQVVAVGLLQKLGCVVDTAQNGREAVELSSTNVYDVILMDCEMPEMDGYEAATRIRQQLRNARVPIVALTAHAAGEVRERCLASGMNDFLAKPFRLEDLHVVLAKYVQGPAAASPL